MDYRSQILKTALVFLIFMSKGLYNELSGPAMIDLKLIFNTNYASLTQAIAGRGIGGVVGALVGGVVADKFEKRLDLCTGLFCIFSAAVLAFIPLAPSMDFLWLLYFGLGLSTCVLNICGTRLALDIWKKSNTGVLQILHMGYGAGALLTPLMCAPFLATVEFSADNSLKVIKESRVQIPFFMIAIFTLALSVPFLLWESDQQQDSDSESGSGKPVVSTAKTAKKRTWVEMINPATYAGGKIYFGSLIVVSLMAYYFNLIGCEKTFGNFVRTFSVDALKFDTIHASYLNTLFWVSFTLGRLFTCFISPFIHIKTLIVAQAIVHLVSVTFLKYYASKTAGLFWVGTFLEGFTISPLYGLGVSFGSTQIEISGMVLTVLVLAGSIGDWTYLKAAGKMYDTHGPSSVLDVMYMAAWVMTGTVAILWISAKKNKSVL